MRAPFGVLFLLACLLASPSLLAREWTNNRGERLEATFVRLRGETAILRAQGKSVRAPVEQLSQADQEWIATYRELATPRGWGENAITGEFKRITREGVEVLAGSKRGVIPFGKLMVADFDAAIALYEHLEKRIPEQVGRERQAAIDRAPPEGLIVRDWTDTRGRQMRAGFEGAKGNAAILWRGSKRFELPLTKLSATDRSWIAQRSLDQLADDLRGGVAATRLIAMQAFVKAMTSGRPMPEFPPPVVEEPPVVVAEAEPPSVPPAEGEVMAPGAYASAPPSRGPPPWVDDIDNLSPNEADARLREAFGDWVDSEEEIGGIGYCSHCNGEFAYPVGFSGGDPACPFCGTALTRDSLEDWDVLEDEDSGWRTPWYLRRTGRRLIIFVVVTVIGAGVKLMLSGGD